MKVNMRFPIYPYVEALTKCALRYQDITYLQNVCICFQFDM